MSLQNEAQARYLPIAARCFADRGFHGTSLAKVAKEAGVSKQALLHFFGTKERLYAEVLRTLCTRLSEQIDCNEAARPEDKLIAYFDTLTTETLACSDDARLVIRALLDSDPNARAWPLKPYLDKLIDLSLETQRWHGAAREEVLMGLYQLIGTIQYFAVSIPTLTGMFDGSEYKGIAQNFVRQNRSIVRDFALKL